MISETSSEIQNYRGNAPKENLHFTKRIFPLLNCINCFPLQIKRFKIRIEIVLFHVNYNLHYIYKIILIVAL